MYFNDILKNRFLFDIGRIRLWERVIVLAVVLVLHAGIASIWLTHSPLRANSFNEMSVSVDLQPTVHLPESQPLPRPESVVKPLARQVERKTAQSRPLPDAAPSLEALKPLPDAAPSLEALKPLPDAAPSHEELESSPDAVPVAPPSPVANVEPDYTAAYLNNPYPAYPVMARRMGWTGRVILDVEVLSAGRCGGISVFRSSGHTVLDNAAMTAVRGWRFSPARHGGVAVTQWFRVPINFSLGDDAP